MTLQSQIVKQQGAVLVVGLIFLVLLTLIGITTMQVSTLQERMAGNARDRELAFQNAEAGLRNGEIYLLGRSYWTYTTTCSNGLCSSGHAPDWSTYAWNGTKDVVATTTLSLVASQSRYFAEYKGESKCAECSRGYKSVYALTAMGTGANANSKAFLREVYRP